jgi:predicted metal-dependent HD superfamily phosphohydrolase
LLPVAPPGRDAESKVGPTIGRGGRPGQGNAVTARNEPSVADLFAPDLLEAATALYDPTLPYHNAGHALRAVTLGERLLRACWQAGVHVDATVVRFALLFHDAGYGTDPSTVGCPDAEAYAGTLARRALTGRLPAPVMDDVEAAILSTRRTTQPDTTEGMVVRAADLADLAADYDTFAANSEALRVEHQRLSGTRLSLAEWRESVDRLLSSYLEERLWPLELHGSSEQPGFHVAAKANLRRYLAQLD